MAQKRQRRAPPNGNSLANLKPIQPGEVRNPTGKNGDHQPITSAIRAVAKEPMPEHLRLAMNIQMRNQLYVTLKGKAPNVKKPEDIPDMFPEGITWAGANAVRLHVSAIVAANITASLEIREAIEGRATTRIEMTSRGDKLDALLEAFQRVADQDANTIDVLPAPSPNGNTNGNTGG